MRSVLESGKEYAEKASEQMSGFRSQIASSREALKSSVKSGVEGTNQLLAILEEKTMSIRAPIVEGMKTAEVEGNKVAKKMWYVYERRHEYGPQIVGGSAVAMGALTSFRRRSPIASLVSAVVTGGLAYAIVYEPIPLQDIPDLVFGKKKDE